ncbi:hypothetical protein EJ06DRAFT_523742 [Trichodelitschia bisporula]|uniref:Uncharacterized protein n=1 Tax=Trichodelitschia bisporula TaxID=703511 RepID=A0A6G1HP64_9PEZI|nr:hypothetical protein EJ06DRAFT_523742 [Trichodelitschia bisporula]
MASSGFTNLNRLRQALSAPKSKVGRKQLKPENWTSTHLKALNCSFVSDMEFECFPADAVNKAVQGALSGILEQPAPSADLAEYELYLLGEIAAYSQALRGRSTHCRDDAAHVVWCYAEFLQSMMFSFADIQRTAHYPRSREIERILYLKIAGRKIELEASELLTYNLRQGSRKVLPMLATVANLPESGVVPYLLAMAQKQLKLCPEATSVFVAVVATSGTECIAEVKFYAATVNRRYMEQLGSLETTPDEKLFVCSSVDYDAVNEGARICIAARLQRALDECIGTAMHNTGGQEATDQRLEAHYLREHEKREQEDREREEREREDSEREEREREGSGYAQGEPGEYKGEDGEDTPDEDILMDECASSEGTSKRKRGGDVDNDHDHDHDGGRDSKRRKGD